MLIISSCIILSYYTSCSFKNEADQTDKVSFNFQVRPILSDKCFNCHGPDANKRQAGLRPDIESEAYKEFKRQNEWTRYNPCKEIILPGYGTWILPTPELEDK